MAADTHFFPTSRFSSLMNFHLLSVLRRTIKINDSWIQNSCSGWKNKNIFKNSQERLKENGVHGLPVWTNLPSCDGLRSIWQIKEVTHLSFSWKWRFRTTVATVKVISQQGKIHKKTCASCSSLPNSFLMYERWHGKFYFLWVFISETPRKIKPLLSSVAGGHCSNNPLHSSSPSAGNSAQSFTQVLSR